MTGWRSACTRTRRDIGAEVYAARWATGWNGVASYRAYDINCVANPNNVDCTDDKGWATQLYLHKE